MPRCHVYGKTYGRVGSHYANRASCRVSVLIYVADTVGMSGPDAGPVGLFRQISNHVTSKPLPSSECSQ